MTNIPRTLTVETLLPHRGRMLLVEEILSLTDERATTLSVARDDWPLCRDGVINPLILVELVAQTAGVHNGLHRIKTRGAGATARGWLVGVKQATLHVDAILPGMVITATAANAFVFDTLREIAGTASMDGRLLAEVTLQVVDGDPE